MPKEETPTETVYTITKSTQPKVVEHPSLTKPPEPPLASSKSAAETLKQLNSAIAGIMETVNKFKTIEADLANLNSVTLLSNLEQKFDAFTASITETNKTIEQKLTALQTAIKEMEP